MMLDSMDEADILRCLSCGWWLPVPMQLATGRSLKKCPQCDSTKIDRRSKVDGRWRSLPVG